MLIQERVRIKNNLTNENLFINSSTKIEIFNDNFQNYKKYGIPKAQLGIADIPYNLGNNAYASSPEWYNEGDNSKGESKKANKSFFNSDYNFNIAEYMHFCSKLLRPEPKETGKAPAMIVFCAFEQMQMIIDYGAKHGFKNSYPLIFIKDSSSQVLKANMKIVGATEYAVVLYREKLPKFNNQGRMVLNWFKWNRDEKRIPKIHPTQKPLKLFDYCIRKSLIEDKEIKTVFDPFMGSGTTAVVCKSLGLDYVGCELDKDYYEIINKRLSQVQGSLF